MVMLKLRNGEDHEELLKKVKRMKKFIEELEDCLEESIEEDEPEYRGGNYRKEDWDDYEMQHGRYGYRKGGRRM